ncbi:MAG: threonine--tRNA ligase [Clostridia bacterium]
MNIKVTLPDGSIREFESGIKLIDVIKSISEGLARSSLCASVNGVMKGLCEIINEDCQLKVFTFKDAEGQEVYRHTCSHILAQAVKNIYPTAKLAIGPAIKNGFYYDFDLTSPITIESFKTIEAEMHKLIKEDLPIVRRELTKAEAFDLFKNRSEEYKLELLAAIAENEIVSIYEQGNYVDLCRGPHLMSTGRIKSFKLTSIAGAYWRGDSKSKMLTRVYGTCFEKKSDLDEYLEKLEDAKRRDHNKLGRELNYFMTSDVIGQGLPLLMPKGAKTVQILQRFVEDEEERRGYQFTKTPLMAKNDLYKISGHWDHYKDGMFIIGDEKVDDEILALRPMTCPFQFQIYKNGLKSYRDLPVRFNETATLFRNESSGEMHGLIRVRQFTLSDGHIMCTREQLEQEFKGVVELGLYFLKSIGLDKDVTYRFSRWDPNNRSKYIDNPKAWEDSENMMKAFLDKMGINYIEAIGEAAFYGPKLDIQAYNVYGKEDTLVTAQLDFELAERFDMTYIDADNVKRNPFIIHRSSMGCYERTLALLIEKYSGALPLWYAPLQVKVMSLTDRTAPNTNEIVSTLRQLGIRAEADNRSEKIGMKIRDAQLDKVPYMLVVGDKDVENGVVSVRDRKDGDIGQMLLEDFIQKVLKEIKSLKVD